MLGGITHVQFEELHLFLHSERIKNPTIVMLDEESKTSRCVRWMNGLLGWFFEGTATQVTSHCWLADNLLRAYIVYLVYLIYIYFIIHFISNRIVPFSDVFWGQRALVCAECRPYLWKLSMNMIVSSTPTFTSIFAVNLENIDTSDDIAYGQMGSNKKSTEMSEFRDQCSLLSPLDS